MAAKRGIFFVIQVVGTLLSRFSGLLRTQIQGALLGAGAYNDILNLSFTIQNLARALFAEEPIKQAFLPTLKAVSGGGDEKRTLLLQRSFVTWLVLLLVAVTGVVWLVMPWLVTFLFGGLDVSETAKVVALSRIGVMFLPFIGLSGYAMSVLYGRETSLGHWVTSLCPIAFNGGVILMGLIGGSYSPWTLKMFAVGTVLGGILQLLVVLPFLQETGVSVWRQFLPTTRLGNDDLREVKSQWWPAVYGSAILQINVTVDRMIASYLQAGAVTALYNATRVFQLPVGMLGVSTAVSLHASLSAEYGSGNYKRFRNSFFWGMENIAFFALPLMAVFMVTAHPVCSLLYEYGRFGPEGIARVALALQCYSVGVFSYCSNQLLRTAFSALKNVQARMWIDSWNFALNIILSLSFLMLFQVIDFPLYPALALGTSVSSIVQSILYYRSLCSEENLRETFFLDTTTLREFGKILLASIFMGVTGWLLWDFLRDLQLLPGLWNRLAIAAILFGAMGVAYLVTCAILRVRHLNHALSSVLRRIPRP